MPCSTCKDNIGRGMKLIFAVILVVEKILYSIILFQNLNIIKPLCRLYKDRLQEMRTGSVH